MRLWKTTHPQKRFQNFHQFLHVIDSSDQNLPIAATSVTFDPSLRHSIGLWLVDFNRSDNNTQDWQKFWKYFRRCFVFQSRVSMKTVVTNNGNWTERRAIWSEIKRGISKLNAYAARVQFEITSLISTYQICFEYIIVSCFTNSWVVLFHLQCE